MKKKIIAVLISVLSIAISFTFGGCFISCLKPPAPTKEDVTHRLKNLWGIELSEDCLTMENYALNVGPRGDGDWLYVFDYNGKDSDFNALLNVKKNEEFEDNFFNIYTMLKDDFNKDFTFPGFEEGYYWLYMEKSSSKESEIKDLRLYVIYFIEKNQLILEFFKL